MISRRLLVKRIKLLQKQDPSFQTSFTTGEDSFIILTEIPIVYILVRPKGMPWLYYGLLSREDASTIASKIPEVKVDVSSGSGVNTLPFVMAVYSLNGTFLGLQNLTTQFEVCFLEDFGESNSWICSTVMIKMIKSRRVGSKSA
jgi:hypothetical protein